MRQYGNLSFARIYDAGHMVPSYQPETSYTVFSRIIKGTDVGMGKRVDLSTFRTAGPKDSTYRNKAIFVQDNNKCWIRMFSIDKNSCSSYQQGEILLGRGIVKNGVWYENEKDYKPPSPVLAGKPGSLPVDQRTLGYTSTSAVPLTGLYTASETPRVSSGASSHKFRSHQRRQVFQPWGLDNEDDSNKRRANRYKKALKIAAGTLGSLLLL